MRVGYPWHLQLAVHHTSIFCKISTKVHCVGSHRGVILLTHEGGMMVSNSLEEG